jgi:hypothetical protein
MANVNLNELVAAVVAVVAAGEVGKTTCTSVAAELDLPDAKKGGAQVVSYLLANGLVPGFKTAQKLGIVPTGFVPASEAKKADAAAKKAAKNAAKAAELEAKLAELKAA